MRATHVTEQTASSGPVRATHMVEWTIDLHGRVPAAGLHAAFTASGIITAAAGDADDTAGQVVMAERSGDMVMRVTRGRIRGATLVSMPAFAAARIVLDGDEVTAACGDKPSGERMRDVVTYVATSPTPVGAAQVADALVITVASARDYLARAAQAGRIVRLARGLYVAASTLPEGAGEVAAAMSGGMEPGDPSLQSSWAGDEMSELEASAWSEMGPCRRCRRRGSASRRPRSCRPVRRGALPGRPHLRVGRPARRPP
ncbi:hypothetical protein [Nonomuraea roseoviolacea]|uniref:Type IV toxin-antitoxin system AbiEi family antitoxin domain-containing protein n=1 Tax=Nonomuraea roseoviolacea subsp. carminata TaxID=160689 RepID=A0ABT1JZY3_9ACTN|nr:hypothetical protein [Nonomuraea roseoviolacea]MCP2346339.1 hypothetical protein [Nonomuraea roseoviolacea subsp. carminata]